MGNAYRTEHDSMGEVQVPADRYWGAQTERSRRNFPIGAGREQMPPEIIHAFALLKKAAAEANAEPEWNIEAGRIDYSLPHVKIVVQVPQDFPYAQLGLDHSYGWRVGDMAIPVYQYGPYGIWGITGRIIQAFLTYLK